MPKFLTNPIFLAVIGGFIISYLIQVLIMGPKEAARKERNEEYVSRLSGDIYQSIETALKDKDKTKAMALLQEHAKIGAAEAKECAVYIRQEMRKK